MKKTTIALVMALSLTAGCLAGCSNEDDNKTTTATTTTASTTAPTTSNIHKPSPDVVTVEHEHKGLRVKLESTFDVALDENDENTLTFTNGKINGTVTFAPLSELAGDATTSKEYAENLKAEYGEATIGTSTNIAFYVVHEEEGSVIVEALYIHGENGWLVTAKAADTSLNNQLVKIVGLCSIDADKVPAE